MILVSLKHAKSTTVAKNRNAGFKTETFYFAGEVHHSTPPPITKRRSSLVEHGLCPEIYAARRIVENDDGC